MSDLLRWRRAGLALVVVLVAVFGYFNSAEAVAVHFGLLVLYRVPLVVLILTAFLLGMVTMFLFGLRHDLVVRRLLRERGHELSVPSPMAAVHEPTTTLPASPPPPPFPPYPPPDSEP